MIVDFGASLPTTLSQDFFTTYKRVVKKRNSCFSILWGQGYMYVVTILITRGLLYTLHKTYESLCVGFMVVVKGNKYCNLYKIGTGLMQGEVNVLSPYLTIVTLKI